MSSGDSSSWSVQDPVWIVRSADERWEGVVLHVGNVEFDSADSWVGVRLTGGSAGKGKNDGTVQGVSYFQCPPECGMFVKATALQPRTLSKLEEMRLKRELRSMAGSISTSSSSSATTTPGRRTSALPSPRTAGGATSARKSPKAASTATSPKPATSAADAVAKKEALAARRAALLARKQEAKAGASATAVATPAAKSAATPAPTTPAPTAATPAPAPAPSAESIAKLKELQEELAKSQEEALMLQTKLATAERKAQDATAQVAQLEQQVAEAEKAAADPTPTLSASSSQMMLIPEETQQELLDLQHTRDLLQDEVARMEQTVQTVRQDLKEAQAGQNKATDECTVLRAQCHSLESELASQDASRKLDAAHYKERAKWQADHAHVVRQVQALEAEKMELDHTIEELALDKEQLLEEKENLADKLEGAKLDAETAQMEAEELKLMLEDAQQVQVASAASLEGDSGENSGETEEKLQALGIQNARLRQALIRLREQSSLDQLESAKALRAVQAQADDGQQLASEVEQLRQEKKRQEEAVNDLKDMVEQGAAFEGMVEDLSDRVMLLEEDNQELRATIRQLEEGMDLTAEMEEVQADEIKVLYRDVEGRDTLIRNLEQAIQIQRRREEDSRRTITNYRSTVEMLKQEKKALLELQEGNQGERSHLEKSSQQALARAAQLVADAADVRKRQARAVLDELDRQVYYHLSNRLEDLLPASVVAAEVSGIKGELLTSKVVGKASKTLAGIEESFRHVMKPALDAPSEEDSAAFSLSDDAKQEVLAMLHQTDFALVVAEGSSDLLRLMAAGQWPEFLPESASVELGTIMGNAVTELDMTIGGALKSLKEEGKLLPEQSDAGAAQQSISMCMQTIQSAMERPEGLIVAEDWAPPAWQLLKDTSLAKYSCIGAAASLSVILEQAEGVKAPMYSLYKRLEQLAVQGRDACLRLVYVDVLNTGVVSELSLLAKAWKEASEGIAGLIKALVESNCEESNVQSCVKSVEESLSQLTKLSSSLRAANLQPSDDEVYHALSPETEDAWLRLSSLTRAVRGVDGDADDVNYAMRARAIEHSLDEAVANEPKLSLANAKVSSLEKSLSTRSKEIAMLNARLSELETILAKSSSAGPNQRSRSTGTKSTEDLNALKEENRVLNEAMEVLQHQVDEYEQEIRALKDFKSPKRGPSSRTPRRSMGPDLTSPAHRGAGGPTGTGEEGNEAGSFALDAALFRPALQSALRETAKWKGVAMNDAMASLAPLPSLTRREQSTAQKEDMMKLSTAINAFRLQAASTKIVDLSSKDESPRQQLNNMHRRQQEVAARLEDAMSRCRSQLSVM